MSESGQGPSRRLIATAFIAITSVTLAQSTFVFMLLPIQAEMAFSVDRANVATLIPSGASLLVVFVAGALGDRIGRRRVLLAGAATYVVGALLVALAPSFGVVFTGRALGGIGGVAMAITGLAILNASFTEDGQRARVFGAIAAATPAVFLVSPVLGSFICQHANWRLVPLLWVGFGVTASLMGMASLPPAPRDSGQRDMPELWTPILAGTVLCGFGIAAATATFGTMIPQLAMAVAVIALVATIILMRRLENPTLDLRVLRVPTAPLVVAAIALTAAPNLFLFTSLLVKYRFQTSVVALSLMLIIPQAAAVAGGLLGGSISARWGAPRTAALAFLLVAVFALGCFALVPTSGVWVPVLILTVIAVPVAAAVGPLTKSLLDLAPADGSGAASSIRSGINSVGSTIGGVLVGSIVFGGFQSSFADQLNATGLSDQQAEVIAEQVRSGVLAADLLMNLPAGVSDVFVSLVAEAGGLHVAEVDAYHSFGLVLFITYACAGLLMLVVARRRLLAAKRPERESPASAA